MRNYLSIIGGWLLVGTGSTIALTVVILALLSLPFEIIAIMRLTGWEWWIAFIAAIVLDTIPFIGQLAWLVLAVMGAYYFISADFNLREAVKGERAWIVLEFVTPDGKPAEMSFNNPRDDLTLSECLKLLPEVQTLLLQEAIQTLPQLAAAEFKSSRCIMSPKDPIKPN